ncbi:uncharacterized protein MELLADRAFT_110356 [Melampsora larici-populina 98AG31]|uniref:Uncharacterized protein n=1 Tax=Melampsora larici-populina (strain 98AG31 / pathotype 3-4-7) TaxID=747676 RepID=F4RZI0_MELLP|nr:uncharacterized protein MELLADRAFT_110356 [Melampsora larici-populina 98AG31]EGG02230.1 hypothetical protein MELLADRAFT_110356 [Melampsora larici-populina 98AG31]
MAPSTRANSSRAQSIAGSIDAFGDDLRRSTQPAIGSRKPSNSTTASKRSRTRPDDRGTRPPTDVRSELPSMEQSQKSERSQSVQESHHQSERLLSPTAENVRLPMSDGPDQPLEPIRLGLEYFRKTRKGKEIHPVDSLPTTEPILTPPRKDSGRRDHRNHSSSRNGSEECERTILPLDEKLVKPMFHQFQLYLDPIITSLKMLHDEMNTIQSLVKTNDANRRLNIIDKTITNLINNVNSQVKTLNQVGIAVQTSTNDVAGVKEELQNWTKTVLQVVEESENVTRMQIIKDNKDNLDEHSKITRDLINKVNENLLTSSDRTVEDPYNKRTCDQISSMQGVMRQLQNMIHRQGEELLVMSSHNEEVIKLLSNLTFEQLKKQGSYENVENGPFEDILHDVPPHMHQARSKSQFETNTFKAKGLTSPADVKHSHQTEAPIVAEGVSKHQTREQTTRTEFTPESELTMKKSKDINTLEKDPDEEESLTGEELELIFAHDHDSLYDDGEYRAVQDECSTSSDVSKVEESFKILDISCLERSLAKAPVFIERQNKQTNLASPFLTTMCNGWKMNMLVDTGACNSLITPRILNKIWFHWEREVKPLKHKRKYFSASGILTAVGEITLPIQFLHESDPELQ